MSFSNKVDSLRGPREFFDVARLNLARCADLIFFASVNDGLLGLMEIAIRGSSRIDQR